MLLDSVVSSTDMWSSALIKWKYGAGYVEHLQGSLFLRLFFQGYSRWHWRGRWPSEFLCSLSYLYPLQKSNKQKLNTIEMHWAIQEASLTVSVMSLPFQVLHQRNKVLTGHFTALTRFERILVGLSIKCGSRLFFLVLQAVPNLKLLESSNAVHQWKLKSYWQSSAKFVALQGKDHILLFTYKVPQSSVRFLGIIILQIINEEKRLHFKMYSVHLFDL